MPAANRVHTPVDCPVCHKTVSRKADLPRHMRTHDENKEALMHACPFPDCDYKTLQKSNVQTHIRTHTRECSKRCPHPGCAFATTDPGTLTRHRKQSHGYEPKVRRNHGGRAARQSATAPYPSRRPIRAEASSAAHPHPLRVATPVSPNSRATSPNSPGSNSSPISQRTASPPFIISPLSSRSPSPPPTTSSHRRSPSISPLSTCRSMSRSCSPILRCQLFVPARLRKRS
ncbi:uncharacterized protein EDB91DRAFT_1163899, partial [Suillus paluster]|uniref:uncharacterized protein n=1 Tax=Suillus paluster TaxID=48578 RepID=UPI001B873D5B